MVSFYHRVCDRHPNDWSLSTAQFDQHLDHYQENFELTDLARVQHSVRHGSPDKPLMSVTFDDGYADNLRHAIPTLLARRIPCTYFVSTDHIRHRRPFPHDLTAGRPLPVHSIAQLRCMAEAGIEIGGHTRDHFDFSRTVDPSTLQDQIGDDRRRLQQMVGQEIRYFAFPFGLKPQLRAAAIEAVIAAGYQGFCSAFGGYNVVGGDAYHIRRFHGDPDLARLKNWTSYDATKLKKEPRLNYRSPHPGDGFESSRTPSELSSS